MSFSIFYYLGPYIISPYEIFTTHTPYIYIHVTHLIFCGRIFKHTTLEIVYDGKGTQKQTHSLLLGSVSQLNEFCTIPSQIFTTNNSQSICQESTSLLPNGIGYTTIFLFQKCDTFDRTKNRRTWLAGVTSQDHPDYTQLIWSSSIKIHFIHSQQLNYLINNAIAFSRNSHLLVSNSLFPVQRHLDLF